MRYFYVSMHYKDSIRSGFMSSFVEAEPFFNLELLKKDVAKKNGFDADKLVMVSWNEVTQEEYETLMETEDES